MPQILESSSSITDDFLCDDCVYRKYVYTNDTCKKCDGSSHYRKYVPTTPSKN